MAGLFVLPWGLYAFNSYGQVLAHVDVMCGMGAFVVWAS